MSQQTWVECLITQQAAGVIYLSTTGSSSILLPTNKYSFGPGYFTLGRTLRFTVLGGLTNAAIAETLTLTLQMGPASSVAAFTTGAIILSSVTTGSSLPFRWSGVVTSRGFSTASQFIGMSEFTAANGVLVAGTPSSQSHFIQQAPITAPAVGTAWDASQTSLLDIYSTWSATSVSAGITVQQYILETLN